MLGSSILQPRRNLCKRIIKTLIKLSKVAGFEINIQTSISYTAETKQITRKLNFEKSFAMTVIKSNWESNPESPTLKPTLQE